MAAERPDPGWVNAAQPTDLVCLSCGAAGLMQLTTGRSQYFDGGRLVDCAGCDYACPECGMHFVSDGGPNDPRQYLPGPAPLAPRPFRFFDREELLREMTRDRTGARSAHPMRAQE